VSLCVGDRIRDWAGTFFMIMNEYHILSPCCVELSLQDVGLDLDRNHVMSHYIFPALNLSKENIMS